MRNLNVQETENIIFDGAHAAVARINLDGEPPAATMTAIQDGNRIFWICNWSHSVTDGATEAQRLEDLGSTANRFSEPLCL